MLDPTTLSLQDWSFWDNFEMNPIYSLYPSQC